MSRLYRGRRMLERTLMGFGLRNNYLAAPPTRLRDIRIDVSEFFDADGGRQPLPCRST